MLRLLPDYAEQTRSETYDRNGSVNEPTRRCFGQRLNCQSIIPGVSRKRRGNRNGPRRRPTAIRSG
jgi:hypothetical protein